MASPELLIKKHTSFALRCLRLLPAPYQIEDSNRLSLACFALSTLDLLGTLEQHVFQKERDECIDWIYSLQQPSGGFAGSHAAGAATTAHLVMSYCALLSLSILRDDFSRLDRPALLHFVKSCQTANGSFLMYPTSSEQDVRSSYCAFVIIALLDEDWETINLVQAASFLLNCQTYEAGFAQSPRLEAQGGSTYCALAALHLAKLDIPEPDRTTAWLVQRQTCPAPQLLIDEDTESDSEAEDVSPEEKAQLEMQAALKAASIAGFQGRAHKDPDACYSWWIKASLEILHPKECLHHRQREHAFLLACQHSMMGGIANFPGRHPDIYHTYLSLAALSLSHHPGLKAIDPAINVSTDALQHARSRLTKTAMNSYA